MPGAGAGTNSECSRLASILYRCVLATQSEPSGSEYKVPKSALAVSGKGKVVMAARLRRSRPVCIPAQMFCSLSLNKASTVLLGGLSGAVTCVKMPPE